MANTQPFTIQSHLESVNADLWLKQEELQTVQKTLKWVLQTIAEMEKLENAYQQKLWELSELAEQEQAISGKIEIAETQQQVFNLVRRDPALTRVSRTPAENNIQSYLNRMALIQSQISDIVIELRQIAEQQEASLTLAELRLRREKTEGIVATVTEEVDDLNQEISSIEETVACLHQQSQLDQDLKLYSDYIFEFWDFNSAHWIHRFLITFGEHQNVPFSKEEIQELIDFIILELAYPAQGWREENKRSFEAELRQSYGRTPELIVAFAHTLHLKQFPRDFFNRRAAFGVCEGDTPEQGVDPWQAQQVLIENTPYNGLPQMLEDAQKDWKSKPRRFHFSFQPPQEGELQTTKQLMSINRFLKDYWRYQNFFEFSINQTIHVYPKRVTQKEQREAYTAYKKQRQGEGQYLN